MLEHEGHTLKKVLHPEFDPEQDLSALVKESQPNLVLFATHVTMAVGDSNQVYQRLRSLGKPILVVDYSGKGVRAFKGVPLTVQEPDRYFNLVESVGNFASELCNAVSETIVK